MTAKKKAGPANPENILPSAADPAPESPAAPAEMPTVKYVAVTCPTCGRDNVRTYAVVNRGSVRVRYHHCRHCGRNFKSHQVKTDAPAK